MTKRRVGELVLDFNVYPRMSLDTTHVRYMREALESGVKLPPIVICSKTLRIVDGFHRQSVYLTVYGADHETTVVEKQYKRDADLFADAMRLNASHGRSLSRYDRAHCVLVAEKLNLTLDETAKALSMTMEKLTELRTTRVAKASTPDQTEVPLKRTISHMSGKTITPEQIKVNESLGGMHQLFYVNQLISLLQSDLIDSANGELLRRLEILADLIHKLKAAA